MATVSELIHSSFRLIGAIAAGETLETEELNDAFVSLNQMIASWNTEGLSLFTRERLGITVGPDSNEYILPTRPMRIEAASVSISNIESPLQIVDSAGWETVPEKQALSVYVQKLFCDYGYPVARAYLWPIPRISGRLEMWSYAVLMQFAAVGDTINLPPGYEQALRYNFAVALLPEYPRSQVDPTLLSQAQNFKASIVQLNAINHDKTAAPNAAVAAAQGVS